MKLCLQQYELDSDDLARRGCTGTVCLMACAASTRTRIEGPYEHDYEGYPDIVPFAPKHDIVQSMQTPHQERFTSCIDFIGAGTIDCHSWVSLLRPLARVRRVRRMLGVFAGLSVVGTYSFAVQKDFHVQHIALACYYRASDHIGQSK